MSHAVLHGAGRSHAVDSSPNKIEKVCSYCTWGGRKSDYCRLQKAGMKDEEAR